MSTIPAGLRGDIMRKRMEDKATIQHIGGMYVGGTTAVDLNPGGEPLLAYETVELYPQEGSDGYPLVSRGYGAIPVYKQFTSSMIGNNAITSNKLGNGTIVNTNEQASKKRLVVSASGSVLFISFID